MNHPKYSCFEIFETTYKVVNNQRIQAFVLVPKNLQPGKHPVMGQFHGGFFVMGYSLDPGCPQWVLENGLRNSALIVAADYRPLPESTGLDMLEDARDFWIWIRENLQTHLSNVMPGIEVGLSKILAYGDSASRALAVQSGLLMKPPRFIKAVIASAPPLEFGSKRTKPIIGAPTVPMHILEEFLKSIDPGKIVTSVVTPERMPIALSLVQQGRFLEFFATHEKLSPLKVLTIIENMPLTVIIHGEDDITMPIERSVKFAELAGKRFGSAKVDLRIQPREHGFNKIATLDLPWLKDGLKQVTEKWLGDK